MEGPTNSSYDALHIHNTDDENRPQLLALRHPWTSYGELITAFVVGMVCQMISLSQDQDTVFNGVTENRGRGGDIFTQW